MSESQLKSHNYVLYGLSAVYLTLTIIFGSKLGAIGIILAQIANMAFRILHGTRFIAKIYSENFGQILKESSPAIQ